MAKIMQLSRPGDEIREVVCTTMEEWWRLNNYEDDCVTVDSEPSFKIGDIVEIAGGENGQSASLLRVVVDIQKDAKTWIITLNKKGEFRRKKVSVITLRLNAEEARDLAKFKKMVGKKSGSEALKFMIKEFPRWNQAVKESLKSAKEAEVKYQNLKKVNTEFMLAFQEMVKAVNGED